MPTKAGPYSARAPKNPLADNQLMEDSGPLDGGAMTRATAGVVASAVHHRAPRRRTTEEKSNE